MSSQTMLERAFIKRTISTEYHLTPGNTKRAVTIACHNCRRVFYTGSPDTSQRENIKFRAASRYARDHAATLDHSLTQSEDETEQ